MNVRMVFLVGMLLLEGSCSFDNMVSRNKSLESDATCRDSQLGSCQWYDGCLEASLDCGEMSYPLAYGKKY